MQISARYARLLKRVVAYQQHQQHQQHNSIQMYFQLVCLCRYAKSLVALKLCPTAHDVTDTPLHATGDETPQAAFSPVRWKDTEEAKELQACLAWNLDSETAMGSEETPSFFSVGIDLVPPGIRLSIASRVPFMRVLILSSAVWISFLHRRPISYVIIVASTRTLHRQTCRVWL